MAFGPGIADDDWSPTSCCSSSGKTSTANLGRWAVGDLREILLELFPRKVIVDEDDLAGPPDRGAVHLEVPDDATLASAALETPVMRQMAAFLDWVDDDVHQLTQNRNLKLADGQALVQDGMIRRRAGRAPA